MKLLDDGDPPKLTLSKLHDISKNNTKICINIENFKTLLCYEIYTHVDIITDVEILKSGHYATIFGMKIYVNRLVESGTYWNEEKFNKLMVLK